MKATDIANLNDEELDRACAHEVNGLVPCDRWKPINFGSAGGPALQKMCDHAPNTCYSSVETGSMLGRIGGVPPYASKLHAAFVLLEFVLDRGMTVSLQSSGPHSEFAGWEVILRDATSGAALATQSDLNLCRAIARVCLEATRRRGKQR